jgi:alkyl sulfatase BDS1-like metallo-beta-lactamase superfamily hydrolase
MAVFTSDEQLYACMRELFGRMEAEDPAAAEGLLKSKMCYVLRFTGPVAEMMVDARKRPLTITYGPTATKPDLDIELTADAFHQILLGELSLPKAVGSKQVKPKGPVWKVTSLADLFHHAQKIYPQVVTT